MDKTRRLLAAMIFNHIAANMKIKYDCRRELIDIFGSFDQLISCGLKHTEVVKNASDHLATPLFYEFWQQLQNAISKIELSDNFNLLDFAEPAEVNIFKTKQSRTLDFLHCLGREIEVIACNDVSYPQRWRGIPQAPSLIFAAGNTALLKSPKICGIVGSRAHSAYGAKVTNYFVDYIGKFGYCFASGGAMGIDATCHNAALKSKFPTLAVLGSGFGRLYPQCNLELFEHILQNDGLLVTEFSYFTPPYKYNFYRRNYLLAALCDFLIVAEAGARSGTLITAEKAIDLGKTVYAVPGSIFSGHSLACHTLIKEGAAILYAPEEITEISAGAITNLNHGFPSGNFSAQETRIIQALQNEDLNLNEMQMCLDLPLAELSLYTAGLIKRGIICLSKGRYALR